MSAKRTSVKRECIQDILHDLNLCYAYMFGDEDDLWAFTTVKERAEFRKAVGALKDAMETEEVTNASKRRRPACKTCGSEGTADTQIKEPVASDFAFFDRTFCGNSGGCPLKASCARCLNRAEKKAATGRLLSFSAFYRKDAKCAYYEERSGS